MKMFQTTRVREDIPSRGGRKPLGCLFDADPYKQSERTSPLVGDGLFRKLGSWEAGNLGR
jgi:hypothetical protein